jgi:hypothetical protein
MKLTTLIVPALILVALSSNIAQSHDGSSQPSRLYELYSWPQSNGVWNFCLLASPGGVNIPVEAIFDKRSRITGINQLERKMSLLSAGTRIIWMSGITAGQTPTRESSRLALPPFHTVEMVKRYALGHRIQMRVPSQSPD